MADNCGRPSPLMQFVDQLSKNRAVLGQSGMYEHQQHGGASLDRQQLDQRLAEELGAGRTAVPSNRQLLGAFRHANELKATGSAWAQSFAQDQPLQHQPAQSVNWANDYAQFQQHSHRERLHTNARTPPAWQQARSHWEPSPSMHYPRPLLTQQQQQLASNNRDTHASVAWVDAYAQMDFADAWQDAPLQYTTGWADEYSSRTATEPTNTDGLAEAAASLAQAVSHDPQMKNSQFVAFMNRLGNKEVSFDKNKLVEHERQATSSADADWATEFLEQNKADNWATQFDSQSNWASQFQHDGSEEIDDAHADHISKEDAAWLKNFAESDWNTAEVAYTPEPVEYELAAENPYKELTDPLQKGLELQTQGLLSDAVLCFEAAVSREQSNSFAWQLLGLAQAENENEQQAIFALEKCVALEPTNGPALMGLAVSYTNEMMREKAYHSLETWLQSNPEYKGISPAQTSDASEFISMDAQHNNVRNLLLAAALQSSSKGKIDADVQSGLGVLFNLSGEYEKAVDCFHAALSVRPSDALLWNKVGATLANSNRSEEAVQAYHQALELRPGFIRARYNLGISCLNLNAHREAAEYFLQALAMQEAAANKLPSKQRNVVSNAIWDTLRLAFVLMNRQDLVLKVANRNLGDFKSEFDLA